MKNIPKNMYMFALACFIALSIFLSRGIFAEGIIACDDLSPFFSLNQLEQYHFTSWFETLQNVPYRARYSLILSWTRFMPIIKLSIAATIALSGFLIFASNIVVLEMIFDDKLKKDEKVFASLASSTFSLFVLSYSKLIHYYTFMVGAGVMFLGWSIFIKSLQKKKVKESIILSLSSAFLLHLVPSIQLVAISYFLFLFSSFLLLLFSNREIRIVLLSIITVLVSHMIPYILYIFWSFGTTNVSLTFQSVAVSYSRIRSNSINPFLFLTFPHSSTLNRFLLGSYILDFYPVFLIPTLICFLTFFKLRKNNLIKTLLALYLISFFFTSGFQSQFSAYQLMKELPSNFPPLRIFSIAFFEILRYPHRWAYIGLYANASLFSCFVIISYRRLREILGNSKSSILSLKKGIACFSLFLIVILPFLTPPFVSIFTGDFGGALRPFTSKEMENIKTIVKNSQGQGKIISFPRTNYRTVRINDHLLFFTDEFYNLFFEVPAIEGVSGTPMTNRFYVSFAHYLLYQNRSDVGRYFSLLGVKYIFFHNDTTEDRMPNETRNVLSSLNAQSDMKLVANEGQYYLFEVINTDVCIPVGARSKSVILFYGPYWIPWRFLSEYDISPYNATVAELVSGEITWNFFWNMSKELKDRMILYIPKNHFDEKDVVLSLLLEEEGIKLKPDLIDSIKLGEDGWKNPDEYFDLSIFGTTNDFFVFSRDKDSKMSFKFDVQEPAEYSLFLKVHTPNGALLTCRLDEETYAFGTNETLAYRFFQIYDGNLEKGVHTFSLKKLDDKPLYFDLVYIIKNNRLASYIAQFEQLVQKNNNLVSDDYLEICQHVSGLEYPRNFSVIYYRRDLYSPNMILKANNDTFRPVKAWYAGSLILVPEHLDIEDLEVLHLPTSDVIRTVTLCYGLYMIILVLVLYLLRKFGTSVLFDFWIQKSKSRQA